MASVAMSNMMLFVILLVNFWCNILSKEYRLGYIAGKTSRNLGWATSAAASTMAVERAEKDGILGSNTIRIIYKDDKSDISTSMGHSMDLYEYHHVDGFIGVGSSRSLLQIGYLFSFWNLPVISQAATSPLLQEKTNYRTLLRVTPPFNKVGNAVYEVVKYFRWKRVLLVSRSSGLCMYSTTAVFTQLSEYHIFIPAWIKYNQLTEESLTHILETIASKARIVYFCGNLDQKTTFLLRAASANLTTEEYVYIFPPYRPLDPPFEPWLDSSNADREILRDAGKHLIQIAITQTGGPEVEQFLDDEVTKMWEHWNYNMTANNRKPSPYSLFLHDGVYLYALTLNRTLEAGLDPRNGTSFVETAKRLTFEGISGLVALDGNGDRQPTCSLWYLKGDDNSSVMWAEAVLSNEPEHRMSIKEEIVWQTKDGKIPLDSPICGYSGELCVEIEEDIMAIVVPVVIFGLLIAMATLGFFLYWRKRLLYKRMNEILWRISYEELNFVDADKYGSRSMASLKLSITGTSHRGSAFQSSTMSSLNTNADTIEGNQIFTKLARYKGQMVSVKTTTVASSLQQRDQEELRMIRDLKHQNVNPFIGACVDVGHPCMLTAYCPKGSLQDLLENDAIKLDGIFKDSLIFDIVNGMIYLHSTQLISHGNLKSSNCVIDNRWVLKITDFYPECLTKHTTGQIGEYESYRAKLWTAPELLRSPLSSCRGSQSGDVYSFAIVLQELLFRDLPFFQEDLSPKEIVGRVAAVGGVPYRPQCPVMSDVKAGFLQLMRMCWSEDPIDRPSFTMVKKLLEKVSDRGKVNIMDRILQKLEAYSTNLEEIVHDRTVALRAEKQKTDTLLYQMLPSVVADKLKQGVNVTPDLYDEATVYFSDIVGFMELAAESSPLEVIVLLSDLYELLDDIVSNFKVYKVETISDSYMVVSGIPENIGHRHVTEIADMSLHILSAALDFRIRHRPKQHLQLRIGLHTGACCAGIVGLAMPRYCLFGDTVNTASRMESNGKGLKIHISQQTYSALTAFDGYILSNRGEIEIKGKGLMSTYWLEGKDGFNQQLLPSL